MWCEKCHYGSASTRPGRCPNCQNNIRLSKSPFPERKTKRGADIEVSTRRDHDEPVRKNRRRAKSEDSE